jgi:two-component sensor histidine kinase
MPFLGPVAAQLLTLVLVAAATAAGAGLGALLAGVSPFAFYFPVVLAAALMGGWPTAVTALVASTLTAGLLFVGPVGLDLGGPAGAVNLVAFVLAGGCAALAGVHVRRLIGALVDYRILEANPAILRMLGAEPSIVGKTGRSVFPQVSEAYLSACDRALGGASVVFEFQGRASGAWYEVHLARVTDGQLAQVVIDISDRKKADARQTELFDELNHRVKNNLAMVSSMLALQARMGEGGRVREHLTKAVDRIQAIAEVHGSLYRTSRKDDVDFAAYLQDLCTRLGSSLVDGDRIRIQVSAAPAALALDRAVALGVVVNELVTNAAKHAYPAPAEGLIEVTLARAPPGLTLCVRDGGQGLPAELNGDGLGMRLVRSLVQQIGATLEIERTPGAVFRVRLAEAAPQAETATATSQARLF